ncbi:hypothetical protein VU04_00765 [Desulfobulbus sp. TB]|nr:hypothetical protein [Desulfobulbus sp. TB]
MVIQGDRTIWPGTDVLHWESRKAFTVQNYVSSLNERFHLDPEGRPKTIKILLNNQEKKEIPEHLTNPAVAELMYTTSCLRFLETRFSFYQTVMTPDNYRRTSEHFRMHAEKNCKIGAYAEKASSSNITINHGMVLAAEDVCHSLLALWGHPYGISLSEFESPILLRGKNTSQVPFIEYILNSPQIRFPKNIDDKLELKENISSLIPPVIQSVFYCLSPNITRQTLADHLSTMVLHWIISHEDAHQYSGHLECFKKLNVAPEDLLFDELVALYSCEEEKKIRKATEMEADMCATMRSVDYLFDSEFLGIVTDWLPASERMEIWKDTAESKGLKAPQRLLLMRLLVSSAIAPLVVFECVSSSIPLSQKSCYPSLMSRILNVIFTVASRSVDVMLHNPMHAVGEFNLNEFPVFFKNALEDAKKTHCIIAELMGRKNEAICFWDRMDIEELSYGLTCIFFIHHGQGQLFKLPVPFPIKHFSDCKNELSDFLSETISMHEIRIEKFLPYKLLVNPSRKDKVLEDRNLAEQRLNMYRGSFKLT